MTAADRLNGLMLNLSRASRGVRTQVDILQAKTGRERWPEDQIAARDEMAVAVEGAEWLLKQPEVRAAALAVIERHAR